MIYAFDRRREMLVEFKSEKAFNAANREIPASEDEYGNGYWLYKAIHRTTAHKWVRDGYQHETGLFVDYDGRIRYAKEDLS
jgi:hypothetical protein